MVTHTGPNKHRADSDGYIKWGIYKPAWQTAATTASTRVLDYDEVRVGNGFGDVEPGCEN